MGLTCGFVFAGGTDFLSTGSAWALFIEKTFSDSSAPLFYFLNTSLETRELKQHQSHLCSLKRTRDNNLFLQSEQHLNASRSRAQSRGKKQLPQNPGEQ